MSREEIHKLLGGYATGTLTPQEQQTLFQAALEDQELFDELAREQALRDLLRDPAARAQLLAAADSAPAPWYRKLWRPVPAVALAALATALVAIVVVRQSRHLQPMSLARLEVPPPPPPQPVAEPQAPAGPEAARKKPLRLERKAAAPAELNKEAIVAAAPPAPASAAPAVSAPASSLLKDTAAPRRFGQTVAAFDEAKVLEDRAKKAELASSGRRDAMTTRPAFQNAPLGGVAEQVTVTAQNQALIPARALPVPVIRYSILRKTSENTFVEVSNDGNVAAGTAIKLRLTPNDAGTLRVVETAPGGRSRELVSRRVERGQSFETEPVEYQELGRLEFQVSLTPTAGVAGAMGVRQFQTAGAQQNQSQNQNQTEDLKQPQAQNRLAAADALQPATVTITINIR